MDVFKWWMDVDVCIQMAVSALNWCFRRHILLRFFVSLNKSGAAHNMLLRLLCQLINKSGAVNSMFLRLLCQLIKNPGAVNSIRQDKLAVLLYLYI